LLCERAVAPKNVLLRVAARVAVLVVVDEKDVLHARLLSVGSDSALDSALDRTTSGPIENRQGDSRLPVLTHDDCFRIAHISDVHCGGPHFVPNLLDRAIDEINDIDPDIVICTGDLTTFGFRPEFQLAREYLDKIECDAFV